MEPSAFNLAVPVSTGDVFLMNTLTDAQVLVSRDVAALVERLSAGSGGDSGTAGRAAGADEALEELASHGFLVGCRESERAALEEHFGQFRDDTSQVRVTILTTLQCNLACRYCYQGDHAGANGPAGKMSAETAADVADWIARQVDEVRPIQLVLTFFDGEPLLNAPAMTAIAEACWRHTRQRRVRQAVNIITNGLLLTPDLVRTMLPFGLTGVKVTLDGDCETHDRLRPARGGRGTFGRIIGNLRQVAPLVPITIGGNFDTATASRYPALLDFLSAQDFAPRIAKVAFKPIIEPAAPSGAGPAAPLCNGACMSAVGPSAGCGAVPASGAAQGARAAADDTMSFLHEETRRRGLPAPDGVHMGPCEIHRRHSHTIGPDGTLYPCAGFTGDRALSIGHIDGRRTDRQAAAAGRVERRQPWRRCGDCPFIPVCGGGCAVASHAELGDMDAPSCHRRSFESALASLAEQAARDASGGIQ